MLDKARYIVVEGPIGVGKTSLSRRLAHQLSADLVLERPEANPFLPRFYSSPERWALPTQLSFLFQRLDCLQPLVEQQARDGCFVADFLLEKDILFARMNLPDDEYALYERILHAVQPPGPQPDLVIYLQARPETLAERIRKRGFEPERHITQAYLERVADRYARFFYQYDAAPLFIVDSEELNPVDDDGDFELLLERLRAMRGYREFFGYAT